MPEPSASITLSELASKVGYQQGFGRGLEYGDVEWVLNQQQAIDDILESGLYRFYKPPKVGGEPTAHSWSFLKPTATLTLPAAAISIDLPADFNGLDGGITIATPARQNYEPLRVLNKEAIDFMSSQSDTQTGRPQNCAIRPKKGTTLTAGQRYELAIWPIADQEYTLRLAYTISPGFLTTANPYPYGGPAHRETLIESCLAVAESRQDDNLGVHATLFMQYLDASISNDGRLQPKVLGYNGDGPRDDEVWRRRRWPTTTIAGQ